TVLWIVLFAGGGVRTDLVVGARAASAPRRRGVEAAGADPRGCGLDGGDRGLGILGRRAMAADDGRVDEAQLDALGQRAPHLAPGQRVHLELQAAGDAAVGVLLARELAGRVLG